MLYCTAGFSPTLAVTSNTSMASVRRVRSSTKALSGTVPFTTNAWPSASDSATPPMLKLVIWITSWLTEARPR
ncbi:MAG: hypothetical protein MUF78_10590 [Candidatus Edwardsbacteria bacterium]|nr:hypothetical protein [Candidatus Edwardsbacteria bacterium]